MDINKLLKNVNNINKYISTTHDVAERLRSSKIQLNMSAVLALTKIRSYEIEYFCKYHENGLACILFERLLCLPASKSWGVLGKELATLLQYWLDALRKHLVRHSDHWWTFLKLLLGYIKELRGKETCLPNILVELTSEGLLDLATMNLPDPLQRQLILHTLNMVTSESSREVRFALRNQYENYFTKLAIHLASGGFVPCQYSILEALLRWLLPRQDRALRQASATKWFPATLYSKAVVNVFLDRSWINFFQDARDLLTAHNTTSELIISVRCLSLTVGTVNIVTDQQPLWLDMSMPLKCLSTLLAPRALQTRGARDHQTFEALVFTEDITDTAKLYRENNQVMLSLTRLGAHSQFAKNHDITAVLTTPIDLHRLDKTLRHIFGDKYQLLFNIEMEAVTQKPSTSQDMGNNYTVGISKPLEVRKEPRSGYLILSKQPTSRRSGPLASPSTASTTSLAQLHDRLAALPRYHFDKEKIGVCADLNLSTVPELSESEDRLTHRRRFGICYKASRKSQSDGEIDTSKRSNRSRNDDKDNTSCLLVATIGSDESLISETKKRLSKRKDYNEAGIVDMLMREAIEASANAVDSGVISAGNKSLNLSEAIENTSCDTEKGKKKTAKVVDSTTTDESNTEFISETPYAYVNVRKSRKNTGTVDSVRKRSFDEQIVEEFFSQHINQNNVGEVIVSPTLARKINDSSSELSDNIGDNELMVDHGIVETNVVDQGIDCLNGIVGKVIDEIKCAESEKKDDEIDMKPKEDTPLQDIMNTSQSSETKKTAVKKSKPKKMAKTKGIKLQYKIVQKQNVEPLKTRSMQNKVNLGIENAKKSTNIGDDTAQLEITNNELTGKSSDNAKKNDIIEPGKNNSTTITTAKESNTPMLRRKRKLYSPKDEQVEKSVQISETEDDEIALSEFKIKNTPKRKATCYKQIERDRQKLVRQPRNRRSKNNVQPQSPRTKKYNDLFDKLKETSEGEQVKLVDKDDDVFNFTTDSEDELFVKKTNLRKRNSNTTVCSVESALPSRGRRNNRTKNNEDKPQASTTKRKVRRKRKNTVQHKLIDERIRAEATKDVLNTSIVVAKTVESTKVPDLVLEDPPVMELINDANVAPQKKTGKKIKTEPKKPNRKHNVPNAQDDRTESPLPGLVVEPVVEINDDVDLSTINKLEKICKGNAENYINESNNTQRLIDFEKINTSQTIDLTELLHDCKNSFEVNRSSNRMEKVKAEKKVIKSNTREGVNEADVCQKANSDISIATEGITAHGDMDETPPKLNEQSFVQRNIEFENVDLHIKDYLKELSKEIDRSSGDTSVGSDKSQNKVCSPSGSRSLVVSLERLSEDDIIRWLPSVHNSESNNSADEDLGVSKFGNITRCASNKTPVTLSQRDNRASIISPIKSLGELNLHDKSIVSTSDDVVMSNTPKRYVKSVRKTLQTPSTSRDSGQCTKDMRTSSDKRSKRYNEKVSLSVDASPNSGVSTTTPGVDKLADCRKRTSAFNRVGAKRMKGNDPEVAAPTISTLTGSSIEDWFKRNRPSSSREDTSTLARDCYQNVLERLNTTLAEINQNTSRKFVHLFVDAQRHLSELKQVQRESFKKVALELLELDKKSQEMMDDFMKQLKDSASRFIHEDCKQKRLMVRLLKEDVEGVVRHLHNKGKSSE